jgi:hypothetical protein
MLGSIATAEPSRPAGLAPAARIDPVPGILAALLVVSIYGGIALSVDFPKVALGFQSDEATYYMMAHSLAVDGDLTYRRGDLTRVWREFRSGPSGVFLKRGRDLDISLHARPPFLQIASRPDPDQDRLYYGKSFAYPLVAAPLVTIFGTNGFLVLHALLLGVMVLAGYLFLATRMRSGVALVLSAGFLLASVAPTYFVWLTPELFNLAAVLVGYFCWLYKEVVPETAAPRGAAWLHRPASDVVAAVLLAAATASKPSNVILIIPLLAWLAWRRRWTRAVVCAAMFGALVAAFFTAIVAIAGEWNFQGGDRRTFYAAYPFQTAAAGFDDVGMDRTTNRVLTEVIFNRSVFWTVLLHNLGYFFVGRYSGVVPYFFPAAFALAAFLLSRARRQPWQYLVLGAAAAEILLLVIWIPYNYFGGGGVVGNRYFMNTYGLFLFLIPPIESLAVAFAPWVIGSLFTAQITLNPFYSSFYPAEAAKHGPLRLLPVELTMVNDLPVNTNLARVRVLFGVKRRFQIYFLDDNAYAPEENSFWVRGGSTAEFLIKTDRPADRLTLRLATGPVANRVTVRIAGERRVIEIPDGRIEEIAIPLDGGFPYQGARVWHVSVISATSFVPMFTTGGPDSRFLGIRVTPELEP